MAFDLVRFPSAAGYWNNIATVLGELAESLDSGLLGAGAERVARSDSQRLGWLLGLLGEHQLADALAAALEGERLVPTPLNAARDASDAPLDPRWRILVNDDVPRRRAGTPENWFGLRPSRGLGLGVRVPGHEAPRRPLEGRR